MDVAIHQVELVGKVPLCDPNQLVNLSQSGRYCVELHCIWIKATALH